MKDKYMTADEVISAWNERLILMVLGESK